ncbi:6-phosphogluconolactonase [Echinococcus granulosus]|uniref:6-phosphogluconolactonase n=2 Tax=Echinococcus granulosus TaxID=6210 RepID=W6UM68_ECHGR|nr:6-phosphogluconolactonase [Echinococcus granulosus]EUB62640.1 6-phosphogluconolactonase [Echinococcus granulosus]
MAQQQGLGMPRVFVSASEEAFKNAVVDEIYSVLRTTTSDRRIVSVGLSGGSMPFQISPGLIALSDVDWSRVHFFFCDERVVPFDDPESTFGVYQRTLFSKLSPAPVVHKIDPTVTTTEEVAELYQNDILEFFGAENGYPVFDLILLGIGPDGHTCSLFPRHKLLEIENLVVAPITDSPKPPPNRVTLTLPVINKANKVMFIVTGANKAEVIKKIIEDDHPSVMYPASMVQPLASKPSWHLDGAAAKLLTSAN